MGIEQEMQSKQGVYREGALLDSGDSVQGLNIRQSQGQTVQRVDPAGVGAVQVRLKILRHIETRRLVQHPNQGET